MFDNNAVRAKRQLLREVAKLCFEGRLVEEIDNIPIVRHPKGALSLRCCIYKSRAITRYRLIAILGYPAEEMDEFRALSDYAEEALKRDKPLEGPVLTIIDEACSGCITSNYVVTDACRGCFARPCIVNCPKGAITMRNGKAYIDPDKCVRCGLCVKVCPYHAIVYVPIPCEESCPFGAIKAVGFDDVWEVAAGAEVTSEREAKEVIEKVLEDEQKFLTTSCCPAYVETVRKHIPELLPFVSRTASPMHYTAEMVKLEMPEVVTVFISPCTAKRYEAWNDLLVDYVITIEELAAMFAAREIEIEEVGPYPLKGNAGSTGRGYPISGGVANAVVKYARELGHEVKIRAINGIAKPTLSQLKAFVNLPSLDFDLLEVMTCEGGCIGGPDVLVGTKVSEKKIKAWVG